MVTIEDLNINSYLSHIKAFYYGSLHFLNNIIYSFCFGIYTSVNNRNSFNMKLKYLSLYIWLHYKYNLSVILLCQDILSAKSSYNYENYLQNSSKVSKYFNCSYNLQ